MSEAENIYVTVGEAQDILGTSSVTMARLIREGLLNTIPDPLDKRLKLILRSEVEALKARTLRGKRDVGKPEA